MVVVVVDHRRVRQGGGGGDMLRFLHDAGGMRDPFGVAGFVGCRRQKAYATFVLVL